MGAFIITSDSVTEWQFGPVRNSLDRRESTTVEDKEEYLIALSVSRFRDHENITFIEAISDSVTESATGIEASFQGGPEITLDADETFSADDPAVYARWFLQDTTLEPIEAQGGKYVRETQEWTTQTPDWAEGGWQ